MCSIESKVNLEIIYRTALRCLGSVVPEMKVSDFDVKNEPVLGYLKGSKERAQLEAALKEIAGKTEEVPIVIGDKEFKTNEVRYQVK